MVIDSLINHLDTVAPFIVRSENIRMVVRDRILLLGKTGSKLFKINLFSKYLN